MTREKLEAVKRTVFGKKVKNLRKQGILPATLYGKKTKSTSLQLNLKTFQKAFSKSGETGLIDLLVEGEKNSRPVLVHNSQYDPITGSFLHVDFYQVDLTEKIKAQIPVVAKGEAPAVSNHLGVLLHVLSVVEIEALPENLPEHFEVDITTLSEVDQAIMVKDLVVDKSKIEVLTNPEEMMFKIGELVAKETEEVKAEEVTEEEGKETEAAATEENKPEVKEEEKK